MEIDIKELAKTVAESLNLKDFKGDIVGVKIVENEIGNVEPGGIGVQKVYHGANEQSNCDTPKVANKKKSSDKKTANQPKPEKPRVTMTFKRKGSVLDGHLTVIFMKLIEEKWIDGSEADFKALFSGQIDEDCILTWKGAFGKSTLVELFRQLVGTGLVVVPDGFTVAGILEGHFKDESGVWLTGLSKGDKPNDKALPLIAWCVKVIKATPNSLMNGGLDDEEDIFGEGYDSYDHQDLQYHQH